VIGGGAGGVRGLMPASASRIARMCSGVVPQQPPARFSSPSFAIASSVAAISSGDSVYSPSSLGSPALGCTLTGNSATRDNSRMCGCSSVAPSEQFRPMAVMGACRMEL